MSSPGERQARSLATRVGESENPELPVLADQEGNVRVGSFYGLAETTSKNAPLGADGAEIVALGGRQRCDGFWLTHRTGRRSRRAVGTRSSCPCWSREADRLTTADTNSGCRAAAVTTARAPGPAPTSATRWVSGRQAQRAAAITSAPDAVLEDDATHAATGEPSRPAAARRTGRRRPRWGGPRRSRRARPQRLRASRRPTRSGRAAYVPVRGCRRWGRAPPRSHPPPTAAAGRRARRPTRTRRRGPPARSAPTRRRLRGAVAKWGSPERNRAISIRPRRAVADGSGTADDGRLPSNRVGRHVSTRFPWR